MKELSIEEKGKAYDEAKARMSRAYNNNRCTIGFMNEIFPELAESEDERIRKELIAMVKLSCTNGDDVDKKIAWLEKQGAKVSAIEGFETEFERQVSYLIASAINKEHEYNQGYVKWTANALLNYAKHEIEKQGEQKLTNNQFTPEQASVLDKHIDKFLEQKPTWSEENESYLNTTIAYLKDAKEFKKTAENCIDWLNSLKDRYTWKPSDEQMYSINWVANVLLKQDGIVEKETSKILDSLYNDLKKLK